LSRLYPGFFASSHDPAQQFRAVERLALTVAFEHGHGDEFDPLVGGKTALAVDTFAPSANALTCFCRSRF
jgi:hypothetical protein